MSSQVLSRKEAKQVDSAVKDIKAEKAPKKAAENSVESFEPTTQVEDATNEAPLSDRATRKKIVQGSGACGFSIVVHVIALVALGLIVMENQLFNEPEEVMVSVVEDIPDEEVTVELDEKIEPVTEVTEDVINQSALAGADGNDARVEAIRAVDQQLVERLEPAPVQVGTPAISLPSSTKAIKAVPDGALGNSRAIVDDYKQAFDRITLEILWALDRSDVLVIWCFDQSESMKDDQREIRARIGKVYSELGLTDAVQGDHLLTAITSFGARQMIHTRKPTSNLEEIRKAIDSVPIDPSGKEFMCEAIGRSIRHHSEYTKRGLCQMLLVVVSDESGEPQSNMNYLEDAINEAKAAKCKTYFLGREAVFGYPYAHISWRHPQTGRVHWLPVNRGPETAFVEQLQTSGLRRRYDAFSSGFGPYEQSRIALETGGIFFMLPSVEAKLVRGEKRRYELEAMAAYRPDLRARAHQFYDQERFPLRQLLGKVISDLNPYDEQKAKIIELRHRFSANPKQFLEQINAEQAKAKIYITYLDAAYKALEENRVLRDKELSPRWLANYDLMKAQLVAYKARVFEYGASLEEIRQNPGIIPVKKKPNLTLSYLDIEPSTKVLGEELTAPLIKQSKAMFKEVIAYHPGTPWAARAKYEMDRGFGIRLRGHYRGPSRPRGPSKPQPPRIPIPKL